MESEQAEAAPVESLLSKPAVASTASSVSIPPAPVLPSYSEARDAVEANMRGLERAMLDRELLRAPELRVIANRYIDTIQDLLALDSAMEQGEVNKTSLRTAENLDIISRLCFRPLWQDDGSQLPATTYGWLLAVDDAARRWQYARRKWLLTECQLKLISIIPQITPVNSSRHKISGEGRVVSALLAPGFMLGDEILRKTEILAE